MGEVPAPEPAAAGATTPPPARAVPIEVALLGVEAVPANASPPVTPAAPTPAPTPAPGVAPAPRRRSRSRRSGASATAPASAVDVPPEPAVVAGPATEPAVQVRRSRARSRRGGATGPEIPAPPATALASPVTALDLRVDASPPPPPPAPAWDWPALSAEEAERLDQLAHRLQISFRHQLLLREAMTHASWNNERGEASGPGRDNERLEYLGDAVLELVVGEYLFRRFPGYDEGRLTQLRASLVNTLTLAKLSERLGLGETLLLGRGAAKTGARQLPSLLANAYEALIGAIFLDQGYRVATRVFLQSIGDLAEWSDQNHKGRLQEVAQLRLGGPPSYRVVAAGGPGHRREYRAEAMVGGKVLGEGRGSTKQAAEQAAAQAALERLAPAAATAAADRAVKRRAPPASEPARVRRRVAEVAADRRAVSTGTPPPLPVPASEVASGRRRGLLGSLRAAADALIGRRPKPTEATPRTGPATESIPRKRPRRGRRGGRGRRRPPATPAGPAP